LRSFFFSASSFNPHHSAPPVPDLFNIVSDNSDGSEEGEEDWFEDTQGAQPVARSSSKMMATVINEVCATTPL
jgi:hypothetical protein